MKQIIIFGALCLTLAQACVNATASSPVERPTAANVSIAPGSLWAAFDDCEFILKTNQSLYYEIGGLPGKTVKADVFRSDGNWIAKNPAGSEPVFSVIVNPESGTINAYIDGQVIFRTKQTGDEPQPETAQ